MTHLKVIGQISAFLLVISSVSRNSLVASALDQPPRGRGFEPSAGHGQSRSNHGPVDLCTLGLGSTLHPFGVGK